MDKWFRKYFVSHKGNNHHPHIFRTRGRLIILSSVLFLEILFVASILVWTRTNFLADVVANVLVREANGDRAFAGLKALTENPLLTAAAQNKAYDMAEKGYFAHVSPDGTTPWFWMDQVHYKFSAAGENLAINFFDSTDVEVAWMNSPKHRDNLLNPDYTEMGIGIAHAEVNGKDTVFVVEFFGRPSSVTDTSAPIRVAVSGTQQKYIAIQSRQPTVKAATTSTPPKPKEQPRVQAQTQAKFDLKSFFQSLFQSGIVSAVVSPRQTVNVLYYILIALVFAALLIAIFTEIRIQRAAPILSGVLLIIILTGVVYVNYLVHTVSSIL
jgi:hypothetical protein